MDEARSMWDHELANPELFEPAHWLANNVTTDEGRDEYLKQKRVCLIRLTCYVRKLTNPIERRLTLEKHCSIQPQR